MALSTKVSVAAPVSVGLPWDTPSCRRAAVRSNRRTWLPRITKKTDAVTRSAGPFLPAILAPFFFRRHRHIGRRIAKSEACASSTLSEVKSDRHTRRLLRPAQPVLEALG